MRKTKLLALILALAMLLSGCVRLVPLETGEAEETERPAKVTQAPERPTEPAGETAYEDMHYVHRELEDFESMIDTMRDYAEEGDGEAALEQFELVYDEYVDMLTEDSLIYLDYSKDVLDSDVQDEMLYADDLVYQVDDLLRAALRDALDSPAGEDFRDYFGEERAEMLAEYEDLPERALELEREITELENLYDEQTLGDGVYYDLDGEHWTYTRLQSDEIYDLSDFELYEVYFGLMDELNAATGDTYLKLVELHKEQAALEGYDNYLDYAYEVVYGRDYSPEYAQELHEAVKTWLSPRFYELEEAYSDLLYADVGFTPDRDLLLRLLRQGIAELPDEVSEVEAMMERCNLMYYTTEPTAATGAYTTALYSYGEPFLFLSSSRSLYDLQTIYHEFGHFLSIYLAPEDDLLCGSMSLDVAEIHSTGMEMLMIDKYDDVFSDPDCAQAAAFQHWYSLLSTLISGCIEDEFQQYVYTTDEELTVEGLNRKYCEIRASYGYNYGAFTNRDTDWMLIPHTFQSPLYYISYAMSVMPTFDMWYTAQSDRDAAIDTYLNIVHTGCYSTPYLELLEECGIRTFQDEDYFADLCQALLDNWEAIALQ